MRYRFFIVLIAGLFFTAPSFAADEKWQWLVIKDGFLFPEEEYNDTEVFEGGAWSLYYHLEQELKVHPSLRRFMVGTQIVLFKIRFDSPGLVTYIEPVERYFWYSIDGMAKPFVDDMMNMIAGLKNWKNTTTGTVYLPIRFRVSGGRIAVDYNAFVTMGVGKIKIGRR